MAGFLIPVGFLSYFTAWGEVELTPDDALGMKSQNKLMNRSQLLIYLNDQHEML